MKVVGGQSCSPQDRFPPSSAQREKSLCLLNIFISYNKDGADRCTQHRPELSPLMWGKKDKYLDGPPALVAATDLGGVGALAARRRFTTCLARLWERLEQIVFLR